MINGTKPDRYGWLSPVYAAAAVNSFEVAAEEAAALQACATGQLPPPRFAVPAAQNA